MTIAADVDAQVTIDSATRDAAIVAATSAVSGFAFSLAQITIAQTDFVSTDAVITELAVLNLQRHQDNLKLQGMQQLEFNPVMKLTKTQMDIVTRTVQSNQWNTVMVSNIKSPTANQEQPWYDPDFS